MPDVRKATTADAGTVSATLASAFAEDPVFRWLSGQADTERRMQPFWRSMVRNGLRDPGHEIHLADDGTSAAVWRGVDRWKLPTAEVVRALPAMARSLRGRLPRALRVLADMEKSHPTAPHYYLEFLGTRRDRQGKGAGSAVLAAMLERCDAEGLPAYLESSNPRNVPFYARHGFVEHHTFQMPPGAPPLLPMWREPRS
jgi:GNAT superfamily N-acetyltransferase